MNDGKPTANCMKCGNPVHGNVTPPGKPVAFFGKKETLNIICGMCVQVVVGFKVPVKREVTKPKLRYLRPLSWHYKEENSLKNMPRCTSEEIGNEN